ncbi:MAG: DUF2878 domain-containing protein [Nitrosomonas sp.]|nr:MAG: DUF2878 domain-containing protein [Nitrosomonas sp.]
MIIRQIGSHLHKAFQGPIAARILNSLAFYGGWTALLVFAAEGQPGKGLLILLGLLAIHFALSHQRLKDVIFFAVITLAGCIIDIGYLSYGVLSYASPNEWVDWLPPPWMVGVYLLFATAVDYSLFWMRSYPIVAAVLGSIGAMMSYIAGVKLGAAQFLLPDHLSLTIIGIVWFFFMPATCWFSAWLDGK